MIEIHRRPIGAGLHMQTSHVTGAILKSNNETERQLKRERKREREGWEGGGTFEFEKYFRFFKTF